MGFRGIDTGVDGILCHARLRSVATNEKHQLNDFNMVIGGVAHFLGVQLNALLIVNLEHFVDFTDGRVLISQDRDAIGR